MWTAIAICYAISVWIEYTMKLVNFIKKQMKIYIKKFGYRR